jgi:LacI family transcriptional regulator
MVDGVIYMSSSLEPEIVELIKQLELPTVLVETTDKEKTFPSVSIDNKEAAYDAVSYLLKRGNEKIAYVGVHKDAVNAAATRFYGYQDALKEQGIEINQNLIYFGDLKAQNGYEAINRILDTETIDAVFCASDEVAMGVINGLREKGLKVPEDVDVIGFDNIHAAEFYYPKLTTVAQPLYDMGSVGMRMLIKYINKKELDEKNYILPYEVIERDSCTK